jgi:hypothetical protein
MQAFQDRAGIAKFIRERFEERYFGPLDQVENPHGFFTMAVCSMLVEAIQSFRGGRGKLESEEDEDEEVQAKKKKKKRKKGPWLWYKAFFKDHPAFGVPPDRADEVYDAIRSGILHGGETTYGWRIVKTSRVAVSLRSKTVCAPLFKKLLVESFNVYLAKLEKAKWVGNEWNAALNRIHGIIQMCEGGPDPDAFPESDSQQPGIVQPEQVGCGGK